MLNSSSIFLQQHDCQLTGCLNAGSCTFTEESKVFSCICQEGWCGKYCGGKLLLNILVAWTELSWYTQALRQRRKRNTRVRWWSVRQVLYGVKLTSVCQAYYVRRTTGYKNRMKQWSGLKIC